MNASVAVPATVAQPVSPRGEPTLRVCMFVYNNCASDARVLKEAKTLTDAGHMVRIVAVLDKNTVPVEDRDGFTIVRIERDPPHYRVLRTSRRARRWLRLKQASARRDLASRGRRVRRRRTVRPPLMFLAAPLVALPLRAYRYARWRVLQRVPPVRRWYYRRRARSRRPLRALVYRIRMRNYRRREGWDRQRQSSALGAGIPGAARQRGPIARAAKAVERRVSHACWRTVMSVHKPLMFADYYRRAYAYAAAEGFDAYHSHDVITLPVGALLAARCGGKLVYDAHELYTEMSTLKGRERVVWQLVERTLIRRADARITVCESIARELSERYRVPPPMTLLNCPPRHVIGASFESPLREKAGLVGDPRKIVLYQGGFAPNRGLEELLAGAHMLDEDAVLLLMGWGRIEEALRRQIADEGLADRVVMTGPAPQSELLAFTAGADIGVIPYKAVGLNNYYTTPNKLFEYMGAGLAIAGSAFPELTRFIDGLHLGRTFDPEDPRDIADAINAMLYEEEMLAQMRQNALEAASRFVWEHESRKLAGVYEAFVAAPAAVAVVAHG